MDILIVGSIVLLALGLVFNVAALRASKGTATVRFRRLMLGGAVMCLIAAPVLLLAAMN